MPPQRIQCHHKEYTNLSYNVTTKKRFIRLPRINGSNKAMPPQKNTAIVESLKYDFSNLSMELPQEAYHNDLTYKVTSVIPVPIRSALIATIKGNFTGYPRDDGNKCYYSTNIHYRCCVIYTLTFATFNDTPELELLEA